jgi:hypothetical protein
LIRKAIPMNPLGGDSSSSGLSRQFHLDFAIVKCRALDDRVCLAIGYIASFGFIAKFS